MFYPIASISFRGEKTYYSSRQMRPDIFKRQVMALDLYFEVRDKSARLNLPTSQG